MRSGRWRPGDRPGPEPLRGPVDLQPANGEEHENALWMILQRHKAAKDRIKLLEAQVARMGEALEAVEWVEKPELVAPGGWCPWCGGERLVTGHYGDCDRKQALASALEVAG